MESGGEADGEGEGRRIQSQGGIGSQGILAHKGPSRSMGNAVTSPIAAPHLARRVSYIGAAQ